MDDVTFVEEGETLQISKSEIQFGVNYEREIHDFLWFGIHAGVRSNLSLDLISLDRLKSEQIIDSQLGTAPFANISLFLVPPQKWLK